MSSLSPPQPTTVNTPQKHGHTRLIILISLSALALIVVLLNLGKGAFQYYRLASASAERFHQRLDVGEYEDIYADASYEFRRATTRTDLIKILDMVHQEMGNSGRTSTVGFHVSWNNGRIWVDQKINTRFALSEGQESFMWVMDRDQLRLYTYHIDSPNLH